MAEWINSAFRVYLRQRYRQIERFMQQPHETQRLLWSQLMQYAQQTEWGKRHEYSSLRRPEDYARRVPVQDYESVKPYIQRMMHGERDVLWPGRVKWFSKSSGTTSDKSKFIPVPAVNLRQCHLMGSRDAMALFYHRQPGANIFAHSAMVMGGSWERFAPYPATMFGDVSAIMIEHLPWIARGNFFPDIATALLPDWEVKLERLAKAGLSNPDVAMIGGVPTWTVMLFRRMLEISGKSNMLELWPRFQLYVHGGVSFTPYRSQFQNFFPSGEVEYLEVYNASEGYFSAQDTANADDGMLLLLQNGIYYEFLPMEEWEQEFPRAIPLWEVETGKNYALVISTNGGLWRYLPGDTVMFTGLNPYRIRVTGRTKQFVNAFGEEVMVDNTDRALAETCMATGAVVSEYTVAPVYLQGGQKGGHEWLIEFECVPADMDHFNTLLDSNLQKINSDYEAKRFGNIALERLMLHAVPQGTFYRWMRARGKFGGQHKVPRLANHREYVEEIKELLRESA
jgi:hypothetical protein